MADTRDDDCGFSRRELLRRAGFIGAAVAVIPVALVRGQGRPSAPAPLETLTAAEAATLEAIVARLIPDRRHRPRRRRSARGALHRPRARRRAGVVARRLRAGLAARRRLCACRRRRAICALAPARQDAVLRDIEGTWPPGSRPIPRRSSTWCGPTRSRARSAIRTTAATRTSSAGI